MEEKILFAKRVEKERIGIVQIVAKIALEEDRIDELMVFFEDQYLANLDGLMDMLGHDLYVLYLQLRENALTKWPHNKLHVLKNNQ